MRRIALAAPASAVKHHDYLYVTNERELHIFDVSDPIVKVRPAWTGPGRRLGPANGGNVCDGHWLPDGYFYSIDLQRRVNILRLVY